MTDAVTDALRDGGPSPRSDAQAAGSEARAGESEARAGGSAGESAGGVSIHAVEFDYALPFFKSLARFVERPEDADFVVVGNCWGDLREAVASMRRVRGAGRTVVFWSAEDPNDFEKFLPQASEADVVFTTDEECVPRYKARLGHERVHWLPWACAPELHRPLPLEEDARDFVVSANWYDRFEARRWAVENVVDPLADAGYGISLFCFEGWTMWPERYGKFWRGGPYYLTSSEQYRHGRVAIGLNNQRSWMDGHPKTVMTSMRTFEVLGCGKPLLASHSDAYERLGFVHGEHMLWSSSPVETLECAERLLGEEGERIARAGREFVLANHTYAHRLRRMVEVVLG